MKKLLLIALFAAISFHSFAYLTQGKWRWRADDGNETTATWLAPENTAPVISSMDNIRFRVQLYNKDTTVSGDYQISYTTDDPTSSSVNWTTITSDASKAWVLASSPFVSNVEPTSQQLTTQPGYTYKAGQIVISDTTVSVSLDSLFESEYEYVIKPTASTLTSTTYYFSTRSGDIDQPDPSLVTAASLPIILSSFNVSADGNRVKLVWTTASEQNNDRFEILRSANGKDNWQVVATQKGSGTTTLSNTYTAYDEHPLNGINYYRLKQYDLDGKSKESEIRSLTMQLVKASIAAYPNPTKGDINFTVNNYSGNSVTAILSDMKGSIVHEEVIAVNAGVSNYKLNLTSKPAPGIYVLQLKANGFNESINIVIQ